MGSHRALSLGRYHEGERDVVITATANTPTAGTRLVVVLHGTSADASFFLTARDPASVQPGEAATNFADLEAIAARGLSVVAIDMGDPTLPDGWGNDTSIARIDEAITWAGTTLGCVTDRIAVVGDSAGGATALGWAGRNPSQVGAISVRGAVTDIQQLYDINSLVKTLVDNAYGGAAAWASARATHDPILNTSLLVPVKDRVRLYYSDGDGLVAPAAQVTPFVTALGCRGVPVGGAGVDHGAVVANIHAASQAQWIAEQLAA